MSVTGDIRTCHRASDIFFCKYCDYDTDCGKQLKAMTEEEREIHYKKIFSEWQVKTFPLSSLTETET